MEKNPTQENLPKYMIIALDFANRIYEGEILEGKKVSGRTTLSAEYNVSPETIRKSVKLLRDMGIVEILPKSGIVVTSREHAYTFMRTYKNKGDISEVKRDLKRRMKEKRELEIRIQKDIEYLIDQTTRVRKLRELDYRQAKMPSGSPHEGETLEGLAFWQETGATVIGVSRGETLFISPGPAFALRAGDLVYYVGTDKAAEKVDKLIEGMF